MSRISSTSTRPVSRPSDAGGNAQFFGQQILAPSDLAAERTPQRRQGILQRPPVPRAGHQSQLAAGKKSFGMLRQMPQQSVKAFARCGRNTELIITIIAIGFIPMR